MGKAARINAAIKAKRKLELEAQKNLELKEEKNIQNPENDEEYVFTEEEQRDKRHEYFLNQIKRIKGIEQKFKAIQNINQPFFKQHQAEYQQKFFEDLSAFNTMCFELEGIEHKKSEHSPYTAARIILYKALIELYIENDFIDPIRQEELEKEIIKAGQILWESEGNRGMKDYLLWSFIPKSQHSLIDILWDGIGEWQA